MGLSLLAFTALRAQFTYTFSSVSGTYTQVSAGGSDLDAIEVDDAHSGAITLPFNFGYNGVAVNSIKVNSNGWLSMDATDGPSNAQGRDNTNFGAANGNVRPGIFPLWDDLDGTGGTARYETTGSAPNRVFTMEWRNWRWDFNATSASISIECKLYETTNVIEFIYRQEAGSVVNNSGGASIGLLAAASGTYISLNGTGASPTASTSTATVNLSTRPSTGRIYRFTPTGCTGPSISSTTSNSPVCANGTLNLTTTATGTAPLAYAWTGAGTFSSTSVSNPTVTNPTTSTYSVTVWNWCGTSANDNTSVTVVQPPTTAAAGTDQNICITSVSTALAANTPTVGTGAWSILAGSPNTSTAQLSSTTSPTATFTPTTSGTYTLRWTITGSAPCAASTDDVVINVRALPTTATVGGTQTICAAGTSTALGGNTPSQGTGQWGVVSGGTGTFSAGTSGSSTFTHTGGAGPVILRWTISNSPCTASSADVTINITPTPTTSNAGPDQTICLSNTSTPLAANTPVNGTGAWSILGGSPNTSTAQLSSTSSPTATFTPTTTGTYTLRWTISNGSCTPSTNDVVITVNPFALPITQTFNASGTFTVPAGVTQITVQAWGGGGAGGGSTNAGGINNRGGAGGGGGAFVSKLLTVTPGSNLSVSVGAAVSGTSGASGSTGNASTILGFQPLVFAAAGSGGAGNTAGGTPTGGAGGTIAASQGDTRIAGANGSNGATGIGASSGAGGAGANGGGTGGAAIGAFTTAAGATGNAPGGAGSGGNTFANGGNTAGGPGAAGRVIISYTPVPSVSASPSTICAGGSSTLTATGGGTYLWSPGGATTASTVVSPGTTTTYSVTVTSTCPAYLTQQVAVNPLPTATASGGGTVCSVDPLPNVTFTFTGTPPYNFTYNPGAVVVTGHGTNTYTITNAPVGTYSVTALSDANCTGTSFGSSASVAVTPAVNWYADVDGDGFGSGPSTGLACAAPNTGDVTNNTDNCPNQANGLQTDTDGDNIGDACDLCDNLTDGDACDDGDPCTTGETLLNCVCQGGTPLPDTDGDGVCDAVDNCDNTANAGQADVDGDNVGDVCDNCPNNANGAQIDTDGDNIGDACDLCDNLTDGDACDDGDPCTTGETLLNCVCQGGTPLPDTDGDGVCDAIDNCDNTANAGQADVDGDNVGDVCDNCPNNANGAQTDTDGDNIGDACDACPNDANNDSDGDGVCGDVDNCPATANNDQADADGDGVGDVCDICPGSDDNVDVDGDGVPDGCDNCPTTANNDQADGDGDGIGDVCDDCPTTSGVVGDPCDDNNCFTSNDVLDANCICAGTSVACDNWTLTIEAGTNGGEIGWQITEDGGPCVLASGGPYGNGSTNNVNVCVPQGNCFNLTFTDAGGNGIVGGGWKLVDNFGRRILDNMGNGGCFTTTTSTARAFCNEPSSSQTVIPIHCDKENWILSDVIIASANSAVSAQYGIGDQTDDGYQFWFQSTCGTYSRRVFRSHALSGGQGPANAIRATKLALGTIYTSPLPVGELLNVRVRTRVNGVDGAWGPACRFRLDPTSCTPTQLNSTVSSPNYSCGVSGKIVGASGNTGKIFADVVTSGGYAATHYRFMFAVPGEGYSRNVVSTNAVCQLGIWQTNPLLCGTYTYEVRVQASFNGGSTYCPLGPLCNVTITNNQPSPYCTSPSVIGGGQDGMDLFDGGDFALYPNPNRGDELYVNMSHLNPEVTSASVDIYDTFGKRVMTTTLPVADGMLNAMLDLGSDIAPGLYMVNVTAGDITHTERLVIQR